MTKKDIAKMLLFSLDHSTATGDHMTVRFCIENMLEFLTVTQVKKVFEAGARFSAATNKA